MRGDVAIRLAALRTEVSPETAEIHQARISAELKAPRPQVAHTRGLRRRLVTLLSAIAVVVLPSGAAIAAESAVPGDTLFPVKRATEWLRSWVDPGVPADHRVDELEKLLDRRADVAVIADRLRDAEKAVDDLGTDSRLRDRLDLARDRIERDYPERDALIPDRRPRDVRDTVPRIDIVDEPRQLRDELPPTDEPLVSDEPPVTEEPRVADDLVPVHEQTTTTQPIRDHRDEPVPVDRLSDGSPPSHRREG